MSEFVDYIGMRGCGFSTSMATGEAKQLGRKHYRYRTVLVVKDMEAWKTEQGEDNVKFWYEDALVVDLERAKTDPVYAMTMIFTLTTEVAKLAYNRETEKMQWEQIVKMRESKGWDSSGSQEEVKERFKPSRHENQLQNLINEISTHWMVSSPGIFDDLWKPGGVPNLEHPVQKALWGGEFG